MTRFLMAALLAASTLGLAPVAMASSAGNAPVVRQVPDGRVAGASEGSFGKQQAAQYNTANGG
jgi:uncharacterized low-complexity protein